MNVNEIARVCHEVNRAYCLALGDTSQPAWDDAPEWQRSSALKGVRMHITDPDAGPEASHEGWMREKVEAGWVYGPVKDPTKKEHPCIVPFDHLPREQQAKDYIFRAVVHALSATTTGTPPHGDRSPGPPNEDIWFCKIGGKIAGLPREADWPMRKAIQAAFHEVTGYASEFVFSGWNGSLTEGERAVVENRPLRMPSATTTARDAAKDGGG